MRSSRRNSHFRFITPLLAVLLGVLVAPGAQAQGDLLGAPTRVILDGRRGTEVILSNIGSEEATYRITLELRRMTEDGSLVEVPEAEIRPVETAALEMIRFAPRRITLPPGQPQAVRISARPGAELPDGEYRAHMSFKALPKPDPVTAPQEQATGVTIRLIPIYGVTIPIIVRHGRLEVQAAMDQPHVVAGEHGPELQFSIARHGDSSTYGELKVFKRGLADPIYFVRGIAVYPELEHRTVALPLTSEQVLAMKGPLRFEYRELPEAGGGLIAAIDTVL